MRHIPLSLCLVVVFSLLNSSCAFIAAQAELAKGKSITAEYHGMENKSVAIVVYAAPATMDEFPSAREDISRFLATKMRLDLPTVRILDFHEVIRWEDDTINWYGLTEKEIGQHFSVDRVLYIEVLDYASRMGTGYGDLQGHLRANCKIFEIDSPGNAPAWSGVFEVVWPKTKPLDPGMISEVALRKRTVELFCEQVMNKLYDHKEYEKSLKDRNTNE